jgi:hypothetical protein
MNKIKLPSMVEYVFEIGVPGTTDKQFTDSVMIFANFLSQQPNIGMFVPAVEENGEWKKLEEPNHYKEWKSELDRGFEHAYENLIMKQYQTALDNVIFEGFEWNTADWCDEPMLEFEDKDGNYLLYDDEDKNFKDAEGVYLNTLEDLIPYSLTLNPKFAKELGLI